MSQFNDVLDSDFQNGFQEVKEEVTRRIKGSTTNTEDIDAIVEMDTKAAAVSATRAGLIDNNSGRWFEQGCLVEVPAGTAVDTKDKYIIQNQIWDVLGPAMGSDPGSVTIICVRRYRRKARQPYLDNELF